MDLQASETYSTESLEIIQKTLELLSVVRDLARAVPLLLKVRLNSPQHAAQRATERGRALVFDNDGPADVSDRVDGGDRNGPDVATRGRRRLALDHERRGARPRRRRPRGHLND